MRKKIIKALIAAIAISMPNITFGGAFKIDVFNKELILQDNCRLPVGRSIGDKEIVILCESPEILPAVTITISAADKCTEDKFNAYLGRAEYFIHQVVTNEEVDGIWYLEYTSKSPARDDIITTRQVSDKKSCFKAISVTKEYLNSFTDFLRQW